MKSTAFKKLSFYNIITSFAKNYKQRNHTIYASRAPIDARGILYLQSADCSKRHFKARAKKNSRPYANNSVFYILKRKRELLPLSPSEIQSTVLITRKKFFCKLKVFAYKKGRQRAFACCRPRKGEKRIEIFCCAEQVKLYFVKSLVAKF